jgi:hypothetical protein
MGNINGQPLICDYFECGQPLAPDQPKTGMQFCQAHDDELTKLIQDGKPGALMKFWIATQGGSKRAAERMMG